MSFILSDIITLRQHLDSLEKTPEYYKPKECPYCQEKIIWFHGCYYRKPDRMSDSEHSLNDIPVPRFKCAACQHTFSTLPECITPRRWYPWVIQQLCLELSLMGYSIRQLHHLFPIARSTLSRWMHWSIHQFDDHRKNLCVSVAAMGYYTTHHTFWCHWFRTNTLSQAMVLIYRAGKCVP